MNKPISILIKETKDNLINVCNQSQLPPSILDLIFENVYVEILHLSKKQYEEDELAYISYLESQNEIDKEINY